MFRGEDSGNSAIVVQENMDSLFVGGEDEEIIAQTVDIVVGLGQQPLLLQGIRGNPAGFPGVDLLGLFLRLSLAEQLGLVAHHLLHGFALERCDLLAHELELIPPQMREILGG